MSRIDEIVRDTLWRVYAVPELRDKLPYYDVYRLEDGTFRCSCQDVLWGHARRLCTHVGVVMLYRLTRELPVQDVYGIVLNLGGGEKIFTREPHVQLLNITGRTVLLYSREKDHVEVLVCRGDKCRVVELKLSKISGRLFTLLSCTSKLA